MWWYNWIHGPKAPNPNGSSGAELMQGQTFKIDYQTKPGAYIGGPVVSTEVSIGELSVRKMSVGFATEVGIGYPLDGFLGLGFKGINSGESPMPCFAVTSWLFIKPSNLLQRSMGDSVNTPVRPTQQPTYMMALQPQLQKPVFCLNLKQSSECILTFGSIDDTQYKGKLMTVAVDNKTFPGWIVDRVILTSGRISITQPMLFGE